MNSPHPDTHAFRATRSPRGGFKNTMSTATVKHTNRIASVIGHHETEQSQIAPSTILIITQALAQITAELTRLTGSLAASTPVARVQAAPVANPRKARAKRAASIKAAQVVIHKRATIDQVAPRLPARLRAKLPKAETSKMRHLTEMERQDIGLLLQQPTLAVKAIAKLYSVTTATIYGLRDKLGINAHKGSPELIAGVKRAQKEGRMIGPRKPSIAKVPPVESAPAETPQAAVA